MNRCESKRFQQSRRAHCTVPHRTAPHLTSPHQQVDSTRHRSLETDTVGALATSSSSSSSTSPRAGAWSGASSLGKRARGGSDEDRKAGNPRDVVGAGELQQQSPPSPKALSSPVGGIGGAQGPPLAAGDASGGGRGGGDAGVASSGKSVAWASKSPLGNPDMAAVLRR